MYIPSFLYSWIFYILEKLGYGILYIVELYLNIKTKGIQVLDKFVLVIVFFFWIFMFLVLLYISYKCGIFKRKKTDYTSYYKYKEKIKVIEKHKKDGYYYVKFILLNHDNTECEYKIHKSVWNNLHLNQETFILLNKNEHEGIVFILGNYKEDNLKTIEKKEEEEKVEEEKKQ